MATLFNPGSFMGPVMPTTTPTTNTGGFASEFYNNINFTPPPVDYNNPGTMEFTNQTNNSVTTTPAIDQGFYNSKFYTDFQNSQGGGGFGTMDMYNSPYFGLMTSGSVGRAKDAAYEQYLAQVGAAQPPLSNQPPPPVTTTTQTTNPYSFTPTDVAGTGGYTTEDWLSSLGGLFSGGLTGAASAAGINEQVARLRALGNAASTDYGNLANQAIQGVQFTPYTITTPGLGTVQETAPGVISQTLTPQQQANVDAAARLQGGLYGQQMPDTSAIQQTAFTGAQGYLTPQQNQQLTNLSGMFGNIAQQAGGAYGAPTGLEGTTQQALQGAAAGLSNIGAGTSGLTGLQGQYTQAAQQAAGMLGGTTQDMANQLFQQQQAMRTPEQERQQLALENRLRAQGRLGTSTAAYGGTPEQLAMAKAIQEQQSSDAYQAMMNAEGMLTSQQNRALGLGSAAGGMANTVSGLLTADQQRALGLLSAGQQGTTLQDQLLSSQLGRAQSSGQAASALAAANQALKQGDVQTAASLFNIGQAAAQLPSTLQGQALQQAGMAQQQALSPAQQQMQQLQQAASMGQQRAGTNLQAGTLFSNLVGTGLQERLTAESAAAALRGKQYASALDALARQNGTTGSNAVAQAVGNVKDTIDAIKGGIDIVSDLFKDVDFSSPDWMNQYGIDAADQALIQQWTVG